MNENHIEKEMIPEHSERIEYQKPSLRIIDLVAEEVMSVGCKLDSGGFAVGSIVACTENSCSSAGS